ncbi:MAG: hypothetical protein KA536_21205 [Saprospiraceae bacterium]|nr:hypothetical protein [Saprospiraceae bacterium]
MTLLDMNSITKNEFKKFSVMCGKPGAAEALNSFLICNNQTLNSPRSFKNYIANYTEIFEWMSSHNNDPIATQIAQEMIASLCGTKSSSNDELKLEDLEKDYEYIKNVVVEGDSKKKINLDFIFRDCFGNPNSKGDFIDCASFTGKLLYTLYVDQPEPNTRKNYVPPSDVGHAFVSLSLVSGGEEKNVTFGFYPEGLVAPIIKPGSKGQIQDDGGHHFDISIEIELTCEEFNSLLNSAISKQKDYHLSNYNCTDYALGLACVLPEQCGSIPDTHGDFPGGGGSNPGDLGEDLRSFNNQGNINTSGGSAPISKCH